jgi:YidC/Oxa1 family membrane protein insertase
MLRASPLVAIGFSKRFQSTSPALNTPTADAVSGSARAPEWASASSNASFENIDLSSSSLLEIPEQIGYLKSLGLDYGWGPTACVEWLLEHVHVLSGMPWYGSIIATALLVRVAMFYPYVGAADNAARLASVQHLTKPLTVKMQDATRANDTAMAMSIRREISKVHAQAGIKLWKTFTPVMQMFVGYGTFVLLRGMGNLPVPGLETGGALWFQNLAVPDPYFLLPVATAGVLHWVLRVRSSP